MTAARQPYDKDRDLAEVNRRRMELAQRVGHLEGVILYRALPELDIAAHVSPICARVAKVLREAVENDHG